MKSNYLIKTFSIFVVLLLLTPIFSISAVSTQEKREHPCGGIYDFRSYNVSIRIRTDASVEVTEILQFRFYSGEFHYAYRYIYYWKLDDVVNACVGEITNDGIIWYTYGEHDHGFIVEKSFSEITIKWFYPTVRVTSSSITKTFILKYVATVVIDAKDGYNILDWEAVPEDTPYVEISHVEVIIPKKFNESQLVISPDPKNVFIKNNFTVIEFEAYDIPKGKKFRVIVEFPKFIEPRLSLRRFFNENVFLLIVILSISTIIFLVCLWYFKGRDEKVSKEILKEIKQKYETMNIFDDLPPPEDITPAEAAALIHKKASAEVGLILLYDLAARGYLKFKILSEDRIDIDLTEKAEKAIKTGISDDLRPYELKFLRKLSKYLEKKTSDTGLSKVDVYDIITLASDLVGDYVFSEKFFRRDREKLIDTWEKRFIIFGLISTIPIILGGLFRISGLMLLGAIGIMMSILGASTTSYVFSCRNAKGVIKAKEAKYYSRVLLKKLRHYAKYEKEKLDTVLKEIFDKKIGWLLLTRHGKKIIPKEIIYEARYHTTEWFPYWIYIHGEEKPSKPLTLSIKLDLINRSFQHFYSQISGISSSGGIGGGSGGGGAGGGGAGAG